MIKNGQLKLALFEKGISQAELGKQAGIPRSYISMAINGRLNLEEYQKGAICRVLDREYEDLFKEE